MIKILEGDCRTTLKALPEKSCRCCVTSPPYWGLRNYGVDSQIGLEPTPQEYVEQLVGVFREVRLVMADDGTLWLNIGDCYAASGKGGNPENSVHKKQSTNRGSELFVKSKRTERGHGRWGGGNNPAIGCKPKDLIGIPWMVAFALRNDGWYLRSDIIWAKPNPMPESVTDRPTRSHEYIFLLSKQAHYYYDYESIKDPPCESSLQRIQQPNFDNQQGGDKDYRNGTNGNRSMRRTLENWANGRAKKDKQRGRSDRHAGFNDRWDQLTPAEQGAFGRNKRDVWTVPPANYPDSHFATFPPDLIKPCIMAGSALGDTILDPFGGSGTTGQVAIELGRKAVLCELNPQYMSLIKDRTNVTAGML